MKDFTFKYGSMGSGKTLELLRYAYNYEEKGFEVLVLKPAIDTKGEDSVVSRVGKTKTNPGLSRKVDALIFPEDDIVEIINRLTDFMPNLILVDEAQFLTAKQVEDLYEYCIVCDVPVVCYGLRNTFETKGFEGSDRIMQLATSFDKIQSICDCGQEAEFNLRLVNDIPVFEGEKVVIDGSDCIVSYIGVCPKCYYRYKYRSEELEPEKIRKR